MSELTKVEDSEDHEVFDINDFTTASDWERFIVQIEELITEWKINSVEALASNYDTNIDFENDEWTQVAETIQFSDELTFTMTFYSIRSNKTSEKLAHHATKSDTKPSQAQTYQEAQLIDFDSIAPVKQTDQELESGDAEKISTNLPPRAMAELLNRTNDFKTPISSTSGILLPQIAFWYGLTHFVVISPTRSSKFINNESKGNLALSSATIAINNTGCLLPIFVQVNSKERDMYIGLCEGSALKTQFQIVHFNYVPSQYAYLPGLLEIFKSKLGSHISSTNLLITISVRFTYLVLENTLLDRQQFGEETQKQLDVETKSLLDEEDTDEAIEEIIFSKISSLPFGSFQDCVDSIYLSCVWSNLSEDIIYDSDTFSDLNPQQSNDWSITLNSLVDKCDFQMTNTLNKFIEESKRTISVHQLIGVHSSQSSSQEGVIGSEAVKQASLNKLAAVGSHRVYNMSSNIVEKAANKMKILNINDSLLPLDKKVLDFIMNYLFPDANLSDTKSKSTTNSQNKNDDISLKNFLKKLNLMKASSTFFNNTGLLNKLVECMCAVNEFGQTRAIAQLWKEFLLEIRFRYESSCFIPGISEKQPDQSTLIAPDLSKCLLHQKLEMLNCCIKKKLDRQRMEIESFLDAKELKQPLKANDSEDDEDSADFYDCEEDDSLMLKEKNLKAEDVTLILKEAESVFEPANAEGRLKRFGEIYLLDRPSEAVYVPITQESTPMTEDMLEQHASVLVSLGSGDDAAMLRAKIQSASLLSDMQSFKAANPGCILEDFVRWYSPRDYIESEDIDGVVKNGVLSQRMTVPGNIWLEAWDQAKNIPARRQKRLFDDTKEAENVFSWLNGLSLGQIVDQLLPILFYSAIFTAYRQVVNLQLNDYLAPTFDVLVNKIIKISRNDDTKKYQEMIGYIKAIEQISSLQKSINSKFDVNKLVKTKDKEDVNEFLKYLLQSISMNETCMVKVPGGAQGPIGKLIKESFKQSILKSGKQKQSRSGYQDMSLFNDEDEQVDHFDKPFKREYIMRSSVPRPAPYSRQSPQRMYCLLRNNEFRLAGAFTEDTMFF